MNKDELIVLHGIKSILQLIAFLLGIIILILLPPDELSLDGWTISIIIVSLFVFVYFMLKGEAINSINKNS